MLTKNGERLYKNMQYVVQERLEEVTRTSVWPLCVNLVDSSIFRGSLEQKEGGVRFLKALKVAWEEHHLCMTMMSDVLMYMVIDVGIWLTVRTVFTRNKQMYLHSTRLEQPFSGTML